MTRQNTYFVIEADKSTSRAYKSDHDITLNTKKKDKDQSNYYRKLLETDV